MVFEDILDGEFASGGENKRVERSKPDRGGVRRLVAASWKMLAILTRWLAVGSDRDRSVVQCLLLPMFGECFPGVFGCEDMASAGRRVPNKTRPLSNDSRG